MASFGIAWARKRNWKRSSKEFPTKLKNWIQNLRYLFGWKICFDSNFVPRRVWNLWTTRKNFAKRPIRSCPSSRSALLMFLWVIQRNQFYAICSTSVFNYLSRSPRRRWYKSVSKTQLTQRIPFREKNCSARTSRWTWNMLKLSR